MKKLTAEIFNGAVREAASICIIGHVSSDGDCIGSCLGAYNYIKNLKGQDFAGLDVYADRPNEKFSYLKGFSSIKTVPSDRTYGLALVLDCASTDRMGRFKRYYDSAPLSILIDHHATNEGFGDYGIVRGQASSASEVLYDLMEKGFFDKSVAECIYTGMVHDTGVFRYSCTGPATMEAAARCIELGVNFTSVIEDSFFSMSYCQKKMLGYILYNMESLCGGRFLYTFLNLETRESLGGTDIDLDGMIDNMRTTEGALAAAFLYETKEGRIKASLRSNTDIIDVSRMAMVYGGGGHVRAAGCFMKNDPERAVRELEGLFMEQYEAAGMP